MSLRGALVTLALALCGCSSTGHYWLDRSRDAADVVTATVGMGFGVKARCGPVNVGLFQGVDSSGLRGGEWRVPLGHDFNPYELTLTAFSTELFGPFPRQVSKRRGKFFVAQGFLGLTLAGRERHGSWRGLDDAGRRTVFFPKGLLERELVPYYTQVEIAAGLFDSFRLGVNPGELLDFVLGWMCVDLWGDDVGQIEPASQPAVLHAPVRLGNGQSSGRGSSHTSRAIPCQWRYQL